ncbi:PREDICTED: putative RNA polymerase II subunit B1 CTD phosphatase RPAP2 [Branchiostoma belcheri]|uniref:RNA polymerase II subunit B1 CTD phosphatase RPAP2 homolog n=1 Tax=Branchiostoma belcheri TaxID=7741 RepID=A0A6P5A1I5_BRABE|nr:PREDICTED: putative RNA polymerase II subunit B1 CTD phosphatase RPAP2 [Branchiostoma belcheri]
MAEEETFKNFLQAMEEENAISKKQTSGERQAEQKSQQQKEQSKAELEAAIRKRVDCEEKAFRIVERLLDNPVDMDFFVNCAQYIEPSHYTDVMVERAIIGQCGYPVCNNKLPKDKPKQQYHIDTKHNKVYDITERKNFCSNWCYKASQYYKNQLFTSPVWAREKERPAAVRLLQRERSVEVNYESCSSQGHHQGTTTDKQKDSTEEKQQTTLEKDPQQEHTAKETDQEKEISGEGAEVEFAKLSLLDTALEQDGSVDSETIEKMPSGGDSAKGDMLLNVEKKMNESQIGSKRHEEQIQTQTTSAQEDFEVGKVPSGEGREVELQTAPGPVVPTRHGASAHVSVAQAVFRSLMEWRTEGTFRFLYGDNVEVNLDLPEVLRFATQEDLRAAAGVTQQCHGNNHHSNSHHGDKNHGNKGTPQQMTDKTAVTAEKPRKVRFEEDQKDFSQPLSICIPEDPCQNQEEVQLGSLQGKDPKGSQEDHVYQGGPDLDPGDLTRATRPLPDLVTLRRDAELFHMRVQEFYRGGTQMPVTQDQELEVKEKKVEDDDRPVILPPVDSQAQRALQHKILLDRLNRVFPSVLAPLRLGVRDFSTELNLLVKTFRLTSDNIIFRPAELKLLAVVLIHILATKVPVIMQSLYCPETAQFLTSLLQPWRLDLQDLDALVSVMRLG